MKDEAAFKKHFKASVRAQGGFSISLSAPVFPGIPDLYCVMPGFAPVLLEAKWLKEVPEKFNRQAGFTELQKNFINNCNKVHKGIAWGLVGMTHKKQIHASLCDVNCNITSDDIYMEHDESISKLENSKELFDVRAMFELYVPKLNYEFQPLLTKDWQPDTLEVTSQLSGETVAHETKDALA